MTFLHKVILIKNSVRLNLTANPDSNLKLTEPQKEVVWDLTTKSGIQ